jgi:hypothetical protein
MIEQKPAGNDLTGEHGGQATGSGCLVALGVAVATGIGLMLLIFPVAYGIDLMTGEDERGTIRGLFLTLASAALGIWGAGWAFRWNTRRQLRAELGARLPGFTGRSIPVGELLNGPAAAGKLGGKYLLAVGRDRFLLMRHFHNTEHLDAFRALVLGQFINAYAPNAVARIMDFAIPYGDVTSVTVEALTAEELRQGAFGRAVAHGLASWALDAAFGTRSTQDIKAAFVRIDLADGQSLVFSVPSRVNAGLVAALSASASETRSTAGHAIDLGDATWDGVETLLEEGGIIDAPTDGWTDFFSALNPQAHRARAFAALAALRVQQEIDRARGDGSRASKPRGISPRSALYRAIAAHPVVTPEDRDRVVDLARRNLREDLAQATEAEHVAAHETLESLLSDWQDRPIDRLRPRRFDTRVVLGLWAAGLLILGTAFNALSGTLRAGGNGDLESGLIVIFAGVAVVVGVNLWSRRSGWLMAAIKSALSLGLAAIVAYATGADHLLTRGPLAPVTHGIASGTAGLFGRAHHPGAVPAVAPSRDAQPVPAEGDTEATRQQAAAPAGAGAPPTAPAQPVSAADAEEREAARLAEAEAFVRGLHQDENWEATGGPPAALRRWLTPELARAVMALDRATDGHGVGFEPSVGSDYIHVIEARYQTRVDYDGAAVRVRFLNVGQPRDITYELVETSAGWRVRDMIGRQPDGALAWRFTTLMQQTLRRADARNTAATPAD